MANHAPMLPTYRSALRHKLAGITAMQQQIDATNTKIRESAEHRLTAVQREIDAVRRKAYTDRKAGERYSELIMERGHLKRLLGS